GDHDGKLTRDEMILLLDRAFCVADRDQDDRLDEREIAEALDLLATSGAGNAGGMRYAGDE
ncbi:MAG TPA: hypothetical protein VH475_01915, partial [Tepidisphaeraceae bacterium]